MNIAHEIYAELKVNEYGSHTGYIDFDRLVALMKSKCITSINVSARNFGLVRIDRDEAIQKMSEEYFTKRVARFEERVSEKLRKPSKLQVSIYMSTRGERLSGRTQYNLSIHSMGIDFTDSEGVEKTYAFD